MSFHHTIALNEVKPDEYSEDTMLTPKYNEDLEIFMHCTGGSASIWKSYFEKKYKRIFELHGFHRFTFNTEGGSID